MYKKSVMGREHPAGRYHSALQTSGITHLQFQGTTSYDRDGGATLAIESASSRQAQRILDRISNGVRQWWRQEIDMSPDKMYNLNLECAPVRRYPTRVKNDISRPQIACNCARGFRCVPLNREVRRGRVGWPERASEARAWRTDLDPASGPEARPREKPDQIMSPRMTENISESETVGINSSKNHTREPKSQRASGMQIPEVEGKFIRYGVPGRRWAASSTTRPHEGGLALLAWDINQKHPVCGASHGFLASTAYCRRPGACTRSDPQEMHINNGRFSIDKPSLA
ncbi:hypothetical protein C8R44DRAFT_861750 [Mycena epipterygia]|nr:hypothetical protein C8R44DRAFT_861750 [Mycena epipterygia]